VSSVPEPRLLRVTDERDPAALAAIRLFVREIGDVQPTADLLSELEEARRGMFSGGGYHLLVLDDGEEAPGAAAAGIYLRGIASGFVAYLAVRADRRRQRWGRRVRARLVESIREEARRLDGREPDCVLGEVERGSRWLAALVRRGRAVPFDFPYFHPWLPRSAEGRYVLYREPIADARPELPPEEVSRIVYAIWRRAYRIRFPLQSELFRHMLERIERQGRTGGGGTPAGLLPAPALTPRDRGAPQDREDRTRKDDAVQGRR
jgi:hypothetical protein